MHACIVDSIWKHESSLDYKHTGLLMSAVSLSLTSAAIACRAQVSVQDKLCCKSVGAHGLWQSAVTYKGGRQQHPQARTLPIAFTATCLPL
jgi:hypothetical protein